MLALPGHSIVLWMTFWWNDMTFGLITRDHGRLMPTFTLTLGQVWLVQSPLLEPDWRALRILASTGKNPAHAQALCYIFGTSQVPTLNGWGNMAQRGPASGAGSTSSSPLWASGAVRVKIVVAKRLLFFWQWHQRSGWVSFTPCQWMKCV